MSVYSPADRGWLDWMFDSTAGYNWPDGIDDDEDED